MRKFGLALVTLILFASLLALAFSTSSNIAFTHKERVESWLNDSNLYGAFVENAIDQAERTAGTDQSGGVSLSDAAVRQAAESAFSAQALQKDVNTFLDSNYAWLEGKTNTPSFNIDLTGAKQNFAEQVGGYVKTYLAGLPVCTPAQLAQLNPQTTDPLTLNCRPDGIDPNAEGTEVTQQIESSTAFLSNPVVTAANINPEGDVQNNGQPYYQRFSNLPTAYQRAKTTPWIAGILVVLSTIGTFFLASRRRNGLKIISAVLAAAGVIMLLTKLVSDQLFKALENHVFNDTTVGQLQKALTNFFHQAESQLVKVDMWFGIAYLVIALLLVAGLLITKQRKIRSPFADEKSLRRAPSPAPAPKPSDPPKPSAPKRPKPPRLVQ